MSTKEEIDSDDKEILSEAVKLAAFIDEIDDKNAKWLMLSAPYTHINYNMRTLINQLHRLRSTGDKIQAANHVADIYLQLFRDQMPDYPYDQIKETVESLWAVGNPEIKAKANKIAGIFDTYCLYFLDEPYKRYNPE